MNMQERFIVIFYDGEEFPQTVDYATVWNIHAFDMNAMLKWHEIEPTRQDYYKIYIACSDREKFKAIIDSHKRFNCEFISMIPNYGTNYMQVQQQLAADGFKHPIDDIRYAEKRKAYKEEVKQAEKVGVFKDPNPNETLNPAIVRQNKRRGKHA